MKRCRCIARVDTIRVSRKAFVIPMARIAEMARKMPKRNRKTSVESLKHKDKRKNIPTEELRDSVGAEKNVAETLDSLKNGP